MPIASTQAATPAAAPRRGRHKAAAIASGLGAAMFVTLPAQVSAHPGDHGHDWLMAARHLLSEPDHLAGIFVAIAAGLYALRRARKRQGRHNPPSH